MELRTASLSGRVIDALDSSPISGVDVSLAPVEGSKVFLTSGGSDSIDTATKMVRRYWSLAGEPQRTVLVRRERAYHGMHTAGTSLARKLWLKIRRFVLSARWESPR